MLQKIKKLIVNQVYFDFKNTFNDCIVTPNLHRLKHSSAYFTTSDTTAKNYQLIIKNKKKLTTTILLVSI